MKLFYYKGKPPNFGDELNTWLWPRILPSFLDEDARTLFYGIGSIIGANPHPHPLGAHKIVFGSGFVAEYHPKPDISCPDWDILFVRGPRTAAELGLAASAAISDPAILIRTVGAIQPAKQGVVSFMPHWESLSRGNWRVACALAGINLIDPTDPVDTILSEIVGSRLVIAEAMHGAIVADALRVPWVPVLPLKVAHRSKWFDWADSLNIVLRQYSHWPSTVMEARLHILRKPITRSPLAGVLNSGMTHASAFRLARLAEKPGCLSDEGLLDRAIRRILEQAHLLRTKYSR